jgi:hypothetical protein
MLSSTLIATAIADNVPLLCGQSDSNEVWTAAVYKVLEEISKQQSWIPEYKGSPCEFLLDFVAWREKASIQLAVESEWEEPAWEIRRDFRKLLPIKAPYKVMIYCTRPGAIHTGTLQQKFMAVLQLFQDHSPDERYIFIEFKKGDHVLAYEWSSRTPDTFCPLLDEKRIQRFKTVGHT